MESRVELFARIRRDARVRSLSIRGLAREHRNGLRMENLLCPACPGEC
jgi:hypothetical protein